MNPKCAKQARAIPTASDTTSHSSKALNSKFTLLNNSPLQRCCPSRINCAAIVRGGFGQGTGDGAADDRAAGETPRRGLSLTCPRAKQTGRVLVVSRQDLRM